MCYSLIALIIAATDPAVAKAEKVIEAPSILERTKTLASDAFEGRAPGSKGEDVTVDYLTAQMKQLGLEPGNPDGSYVQKVPMVSTIATYKADLQTAGKHRELVAKRDIVAVTQRLVPKVSIDNTDMVFVGYGVVAPEYAWDDFKDTDVRGKTVVMLVNDPQVPDPKDPTKLDPALFKGKAMTYYGRWNYKYDIAAKKGAAAVLIIHDTDGAGYPWQVVSESWGRENFTTVTPDKNASRCAIDGWISGKTADSLFKASGLDLAALRKQALSRDFRPVPLKSKLSVTLEQTQKPIASRNVVGKISGSGDRYLIYTAHWDHFGRDEKRQGDQVFHGALDNAIGVAGMLEIAKAFKALKTPLKATVVFISTTGEERNLLGARYYVDNPLYPLERTLADLNIDFANAWGRTSDLEIIGDRNVTLFDTLEGILETHDRTLSLEPMPEKGLAYRADNFVFAKAGVPSMWCFKGDSFIGKPATFGREKTKEFSSRDYHQVTDTVKPDWDLSGAVEDMQAFFELGAAIAQGTRWPEWLRGSEWAAKRSESASLRN